MLKLTKEEDISTKTAGSSIQQVKSQATIHVQVLSLKFEEKTTSENLEINDIINDWNFYVEITSKPVKRVKEMIMLETSSKNSTGYQAIYSSPNDSKTTHTEPCY